MARVFRVLFPLGLLLSVASCRDLGFEPLKPPRPASQADGALQVFFSQVDKSLAENKRNPDSIAQHCAQRIAAAKASLAIACHEIDNQVIIDAILAARQRGVSVRVITESDYLQDAGPIAFERAGIPVVSDHRSALMHDKFMVIDGVAVWTGSFNFTENCAYKNNNNGVFLIDSALADNYLTWFNWYWEHGRTGRKGRGGAGRQTPYPSVKFADGTIVETRLTSFDSLDRAAIDLIRTATTSVKFLAFSFTHDGIAKAMIERAQHGVAVVGVIEARNQASSVLHRLNQHEGIKVLPDGNRFNMHHKVIIVDDRAVLTGSFNFSANATTDNDENLIIIHSPAMAAQFDQEFQRIYAQAVSGPARVQDADAMATKRTARTRR